jgi:hypothetical protein
VGIILIILKVQQAEKEFIRGMLQTINRIFADGDGRVLRQPVFYKIALP